MKCECCGEEMVKAKESTVIPQGGSLFHLCVKYENDETRYYKDLTVDECIDVIGIKAGACADKIRESLCEADLEWEGSDARTPEV